VLLLLGGVLDAVAPAELAALPVWEGAKVLEPLWLKLDVPVDEDEVVAATLAEREALTSGVAAAVLLWEPETLLLCEAVTVAAPLTLAEPLTLCEGLLDSLALPVSVPLRLLLALPEPLLVGETESDGDSEAELEVDGSTEAERLLLAVTELVALPVVLPVVLTLGVAEAAASVRSVRLKVYCSGGEA
jgi:hypothetical protein